MWCPATPGAFIPATARLSNAFYDRLGDDRANELVEWFNQVDLTHRTELRELNDLNVARFDARLVSAWLSSRRGWSTGWESEAAGSSAPGSFS